MGTESGVLRGKHFFFRFWPFLPMGWWFFMFLVCFEFPVVEFGRNTSIGTKEAALLLFFIFLALLVSPTPPGRVFFVFFCFFPFLPLLSL